MRFTAIILSFLAFVACQPKTYKQVFSGYSTKGFHARGMAASDSLLYISGAKGKVTVLDLKTMALVDSFSLPASDFRGVQFVSPNSLLLMNSGENGLVYSYDLSARKADTVLYQPGAFYDALSIGKNGTGFLMGDPIDGEFTIYKTTDYGKEWTALHSLPKPLKNEAGFAASNTGLAQIESTVYIATGASDTARLLKSNDKGVSWKAINTPLKSGESYGIYSMAFWSAKEGMIAGGSYKDQHETDSICFLTADGGFTWTDRSKGLRGYTSCITASENGELIVATGRLGVSISKNAGKTWSLLTSQPFYTAKIIGSYICLTGKNGTLAIFEKE